MFLKIGSLLLVLSAVTASPVEYVQATPQTPTLSVASQQALIQAQAQYRLAKAQPQAQPQLSYDPAALAAAQGPPARVAAPDQYVDPRQLAKYGGAAAPAGPPPGQYQPNPEDFDPNPQYQFSFDVKDDEFTNYQNRKEQREGGKISGSYSVVDADGFIRTVKYTADPKQGFKAEVIREPTNIVIKFPTPAPALAQPQQPQPQPHQPQPQIQPGPTISPARQLQTQKYLQGSLGVQPPQAQLYTSLSQLPKRIPHLGSSLPSSSHAAQAVQAAQAAQASAAAVAAAAAQAQQYTPTAAPQTPSYYAQAQQYLAQLTQSQPHTQSSSPQYSAAPAPVAVPRYQLQSSPAASASQSQSVKAGAIGYATQEPGRGSVIYQAYEQ